MILKKEEDAFGIALYNYVTGKDPYAQTVMEFDDGYINAGAVKFYTMGAEHWSQSAIDYLNRSFGKVLDIGVGGGRFAIYLQEKGLDVTGIDISPYCIKVSRKLGLKKALLTDLFSMKERNIYNTVLMLGNNFGLMESKKHSVKMLKKLYDITTHDCVILAQSMNPYKSGIVKGKKYINEQKTKGRMPGQVRFRHRYEKIKGPWHFYLFVSPAEMKLLLKGSGFYIDNIYINDSGIGPYTAILKKN